MAFLLSIVKPPPSWGHADLIALIDTVSKQIETEPKNAALHLRRGQLYRFHLDWALAERDYDRAVQLDPKLNAVYLDRGKMLFESGQNDRAKIDLDKYLTGQADDVDALMTRARILMKLGQHHAAIADFNRAINHAPEPMADYFLERARAQAEGGDNDAALRGLDQGLKRLGPSITLLVYAIELDVAAKHFDNALSRLETISSRVERKEKWLAQRGEILVLASRRDEAQKSFHEALTAIELLPPRLRQTPAMLDLKKRVDHALVSLTIDLNNAKK